MLVCKVEIEVSLPRQAYIGIIRKKMLIWLDLEGNDVLLFRLEDLLCFAQSCYEASA